ncbi:polyketide cyclase [Rhodococcus sp. 06-418-5]|uniref:SRPBCC family protein n=1 Tax=Rhodococcus sp. 06-418-5 TaxID=2022507 RepID=UPI000B9C6561|nr:SRPBCC family protein [Rhodococcus sp. 06-418-5]OZC72905.1 polyketide cyclase [Rhodococcus sp. 06-418-5]
MKRELTVSDSIVVHADADTLYAAISDPTEMGRWSPENTGATVHEPRESAYVGMVFDGTNKRGRAKWVTRCTVTAADPGKTFEFRVHAIGKSAPKIKGANATWRYDFEPVEGGTKVTETWTDDRTKWPDALALVFDKIVTSGKTFPQFQRRNIRKTLENLQKLYA